MVISMESIYDIQQFLKRFGTYIYTGSRTGDLELMAMEIEELHRIDAIEVNDYLKAKLLIRQEMRNLQ